MHVSYLSDFISDVTSNTLLLIPNEFVTAVQGLETLEQLEIQYSRQALAMPERHNIS